MYILCVRVGISRVPKPQHPLQLSLHRAGAYVFARGGRTRGLWASYVWLVGELRNYEERREQQLSPKAALSCRMII